MAKSMYVRAQLVARISPIGYTPPPHGNSL